jgi:prophage maintenance system killer protein
MRFPDKLDVLTVHARLIAETGGTGGIRDEGLLESALAATENRHHYEAADVVKLCRGLRISSGAGARIHRRQQAHSSGDY